MSAANPQVMATFAKLTFMSFKLQVPLKWQAPVGDPDEQQYRDAFTPEERSVPPGNTPLVMPATPNKYHVDTQKTLNKAFSDFIDDACKAICKAWDEWQMAATMAGVIINGPTATVGNIVGPPWMPTILREMKKDTAMQIKFAKTIATVFSNAWMQFVPTIKISGFPAYPAFAVMASPVAPPVPNVPIPLASCASVPVPLSKMMLKQQLVLQLADPTEPWHGYVFEAIADGFEKTFNIWKGSTMLTNILGTGPVPTFAPPVVPAGPVVMGTGTMPPGGIKTVPMPPPPPMPMDPPPPPPQKPPPPVGVA
jgi:hypothetical protein